MDFDFPHNSLYQPLVVQTIIAVVTVGIPRLPVQGIEKLVKGINNSSSVNGGKV